jgi:hypothetical protein
LDLVDEAGQRGASAEESSGGEVEVLGYVVAVAVAGVDLGLDGVPGVNVEWLRGQVVRQRLVTPVGRGEQPGQGDGLRVGCRLDGGAVAVAGGVPMFLENREALMERAI